MYIADFEKIFFFLRLSTMLAHIFEKYGQFCAGHPLEVIVTIFTLTACMLNMDTGNGQAREENLPVYCHHSKCDTMVSKDCQEILNALVGFVKKLLSCKVAVFTIFCI